MIKITNNTGIDRKVLTVTQGAYENIYRKLGYVPFVPEGGGKHAETETPQKTEDELFRERIEEKPIAQWNAAELKRYAVLVGIDPKLKAADLKEAIKQAIADRDAAASTGSATSDREPVERTDKETNDGTD